MALGSPDAPNPADIVAAESQAKTAYNLLNPLEWFLGRVLGGNRQSHPVELVGKRRNVAVTAEPVTDNQGVHDDIYVMYT